jgi:1-acyl-sn-glycerol-3-phosphate acyltransferase
MRAESSPNTAALRHPLGILAYNAVYWPYLLSSCAALFLPAVGLYAASLAFDKKRRLLHAYTSLWGAHYLAWAPFAGVEVKGREGVRDGGPYVFVSNHLSMVDILAVFAMRLPFLWVSKIENFYVPFLGWNMFLNGYVPLRRGHLPSILRMLRACNARLREGHSLFVFPEGTRSADGELKEFFRGAFWIAARNNVPVVPVVICGTDRVLAKNSMRIVPQQVQVHILEPIEPASVNFDSRRLRDLVHSRMVSELHRMRGEPEAPRQSTITGNSLAAE